MGLLAKYKDGNVNVAMFSDGTRITYNDEDHFDFEYPISFDCKVTDRCDIGCVFCHENSTKEGKHADVKNIKLFDSLHPYTEIALGGGNVLSLPDLDWLLNKLHDKKVIVNITVNQIHFMKDYNRIKKFVDDGLVKGVGVSITVPTKSFLEKAKTIPNLVCHVINGIFTKKDFEQLKNNQLKLLILGYKDLRRGHSYITNPAVKKNQTWLKNNLKTVTEGFSYTAFDNLGVRQLPVKDIASDWEQTYQGEDGRQTGTMFVDCVTEEYALSSTSTTRYKLEDSITTMFQKIKSLT